MQSIHTRELTAAALFCALTAICSQISLPLPFTPVPINLAAFAVLAAAGLLGCRGAVLSVAAYLLLGAAGVPVFAGFRGGLSVLAGPTGGYLAGYLAAAWITGWLLKAPSAGDSLVLNADRQRAGRRPGQLRGPLSARRRGQDRCCGFFDTEIAAKSAASINLI